MSTVGRKDKSTSLISNEAYELFDCFADELRDVLYDLAQDIAEDESKKTPDGLTVISIEHVKHAADLLIQALKQEANSPTAPSGMAEHVNEMTSCIESKLAH